MNRILYKEQLSEDVFLMRAETPLIAECPINIECHLKQTIPLGTHDLFIGQVAAVQLSPEVLDEQGRVDHGKLNPILYVGSEYWGLGSLLEL